MKRFKISLLMVMVLVFAISMTTADCQLLKNVIKTKGGGGSDVVKLISYIPEDAQLLISINWENLAKTDLLDLAKAQLGEDFQIIEAMGVDIKSDIQHAILGITFDEEPIAYGIVAGKFNEAKIMKTFKDQGAEVESKKIGGKKAYALEGLYFIFAPEGVLFTASEGEGTEQAFEKMLTVGEKNLANNQKMVKLVTDTDTSATAWGVFVIPDKLKEEMKSDSEEIPFDVDAVQSIGSSLNYAEKILFKGAIHFSKKGEADKLDKFLTEQLGKLNPEENPNMPEEVLDLIKGIGHKVDGNALRVNVSATLDQLKPIIREITGIPMDEEGEDEGEEWGDDEGEEEKDEDNGEEEEEEDDDWGE